tara:strand:- start:12050 stop:13990 length:1941 start_codon:yes stop_codon:yes gene_type:complete
MPLSRVQNQKDRQFGSLGISDAEPLLVNAAHGPIPQAGELDINSVIAITLTGIVSFLMMAGAIFLAFEGRDTFSTFSSAFHASSKPETSRTADGKTNRARTTVQNAPNRRTFTLSVAETDGRSAQLRNQEFEWLNVSLATSATILTADIPAPEDVDDDMGVAMTPTEDTAPNIASQVYGEAVDTEVLISSKPMLMDAAPPLAVSDASAVAFILDQSPTVPVGPPSPAFAYAAVPSEFPAVVSSIASNVPDNVSVVPKRRVGAGSTERLIKLEEESLVTEVLDQNGFTLGTSAQIVEATRNVLGLSNLPARTRLRILYRTGDETEASRPVRLSVYLHDEQTNSDAHAFTVAQTDSGRFVLALEPPSIPFPEESAERVDVAALPTLYRSIWETGRRSDLPDHVIEDLISIFSNDADLRKTVAPGDKLEILKANATQDHEDLLYVSLVSKGEKLELFRFTDRSGAVGYFDREGASGGALLLRRPLEGGGILTSPMGMRVHPVTGRRLGHEGVDLAAGAGTPIYAGGDGEVKLAGWNGNYGRQVQLTHVNGFETSYSHMSGIADGIAPGTQVEQGQVIGYVGTTGLSTGNHLHYEVTVNDRLVDALSVRLPPRKAVMPGEMGNFADVVYSVEQLLEEETPRQLPSPSNRS